MQTLDLYKGRKFNVVNVGGQELKIPDEYTVEEVERLLELKMKQEEIEALPVAKESKKVQLASFWENVFDQLEIIFQHYQPEVDVKYLKKHVSHNEALEIVGFFQKYRRLALKDIIDQENAPEVKKKLKKN